jgi:predicted AAA+ superfamily ATPase
VQTVLRGLNLQVHFYRDYSVPGNRRSPIEEVDFAVEAPSGVLLPVEVKFRGRIDREDWAGVRSFVARFEAPWGLVVTRGTFRWEAADRVLLVPLLDFLLAF